MKQQQKKQMNQPGSSKHKKRIRRSFLACGIIMLVSGVILAQASGVLGTWTAPALHILFGTGQTSQKILQQSPRSYPHITGAETPMASKPAPAKPPTLAAMSLARITPLIAPALSGEGAWVTQGSTPAPYTSLPLISKTFLRPDPLRPSAVVTMIQFDTRFLKLHMVAGTTQPGGPRGMYGPGVIPAVDQQGNALLAAFNGGFMYADGNYGMQVGGTVYAPPQPGDATIAVTKTGQIIIGTWGVDPRLNSSYPGLLAWRQNVLLLINHGIINPLTQNGSLWGLTVLNQPWAYTWRSGLGITAQGSLIYAEGSLLSAQTLAVALHAAGAMMAMQTDINHFWVRCFLYNHSQNGSLQISRLDPGMYGTGNEYLQSTFRDFFYLTRLPSVSLPSAKLNDAE